MKIICSRCGEVLEFNKEDARWNYRGSGYDTRLYDCPVCGQVNIVGYWEEPDRTAWYYEYGRKKST